MQAVRHTLDPLQARLPAFSVDWRFLLPLRPGARMLVLVSGAQDAVPFFGELGLNVTTWDMGLLATAKLPLASGRFDVVASPFGVPAGLLEASLLSDLLEPEGSLLIGFSNSRGFRRRPESGLAAHSLPSILRRLRALGMQVSGVYGAVPGLRKPAYILPLRPQALSFFIQHHYHSRRLAPLLRLLSLPFFSMSLSHFLPAYFVVATG